MFQIMLAFVHPGSDMMGFFLGGLFETSRGAVEVNGTGKVTLELRKPRNVCYEDALELFKKMQWAFGGGQVYPNIETVAGRGLFVANDEKAVDIMRQVHEGGIAILTSRRNQMRRVIEWWDAGRPQGAALEALMKEVNDPDRPAVLQSRLEGDESCAKCGVKNRGGKTLKRCSGCQIPVYCCRECQEKDWSAHKKLCKATRELEKIKEQGSE